MIEEKPELVGRDIGLYDSDTNVDLFVEKAVEITFECTNLSEGGRAFLFYTTCAKGTIVQFADWYPFEDFGMSVHYRLNDDTIYHPDSLQGFSACLGVPAKDLRDWAFIYAPTVDV